MTRHTYACNHLTKFKDVITGNGRYKSDKIYLEKCVKSHLNNFFLAGFSHLKPLCKVNDEVLNALTAAAGGVIANPNVTGSGKIVIAVYPFTAIEQGKDLLYHLDNIF